jgi:hypothetical protein
MPRSELTVYHGGHLDLVLESEHLVPIVEAFLNIETPGPGRPAGQVPGSA